MALSTAHAPLRYEFFVAEQSATPGAQGPTVYVETSVVSYLTARLSNSLSVARHQRMTRVWWHRYRRNHALRISERVVEEAGSGDQVASRARLDAIWGIVTLRFDGPSGSLRAIAQKCEVEGFRCPEICTPEHLMRTYVYARSIA